MKNSRRKGGRRIAAAAAAMTLAACAASAPEGVVVEVPTTHPEPPPDTTTSTTPVPVPVAPDAGGAGVQDAPPASSAPTPEGSDRTDPPSSEAPLSPSESDVQTATVSFYGGESGPSTASGEPFDASDLTFAHRTMEFGTRVRFCHAGACVVARCTDRGPFIAGRLFDLSEAAFAAIAPLSAGVVEVSWQVAA